MLHLYTCILIEVLLFYLSAPNGIIEVPINVSLNDINFSLNDTSGHSIKYTNMFLTYFKCICLDSYLISSYTVLGVDPRYQIQWVKAYTDFNFKVYVVILLFSQKP